MPFGYCNVGVIQQNAELGLHNAQCWTGRGEPRPKATLSKGNTRLGRCSTWLEATFGRLAHFFYNPQSVHRASAYASPFGAFQANDETVLPCAISDSRPHGSGGLRNAGPKGRRPHEPVDQTTVGEFELTLNQDNGPFTFRVGSWLGAALLALLIYLGLAWSAFDFTIDDTFISMRYADHLARYGELVWNPQETPRVEGYSNLLWVLLLGVLYRVLPSDPFLVAKALSLFFGAGTLIVFSLLACQVLRNRVFAFFGAVLLAISRPFILWGCSGMETTLYTFLVCLVVYFLVREEAGGLCLLTPVLLFLVCLTRTEGVVFFGAAVCFRLLRPRAVREHRYGLSSRRWILWNALFFFFVAVWLTWKYLYYGSLIPLPVHLKTALGLSGVRYVAAFFLSLTPFVPFMMLGAVLWDSHGNPGHVVFALVFFFAALCAANPIMGMEYRLALAGLPLVILLAMLGMAWIVKRLSGWQQWAVAGASFAVLGCWSMGAPWSYPARLRSASSHYRVLTDVHIPLGKWFGEKSKSHDDLCVALADAGATAFYCRCRVIDFFGLNDVEFARTPMTPARLLAREPDFIVLKSKSWEEFSGTETPYGLLSDSIHSAPAFHERFRLVNRWMSASPFYCLWVFGCHPASAPDYEADEEDGAGPKERRENADS